MDKQRYMLRDWKKAQFETLLTKLGIEPSDVVPSVYEGIKDLRLIFEPQEDGQNVNVGIAGIYWSLPNRSDARSFEYNTLLL